MPLRTVIFIRLLRKPLGIAAMTLGAGRENKDSSIDLVGWYQSTCPKRREKTKRAAIINLPL